MLRNDCPVFMGGISGTVDGHAWVIDGFENTTSTTTWYRNGEYSHSTSNTNSYIHCNWGWGPKYNCYCLEDSFVIYGNRMREEYYFENVKIIPNIHY